MSYIVKLLLVLMIMMTFPVGGEFPVKTEDEVEEPDEFANKIELINGETVSLNAEEIQNAVKNKEYFGNGYLFWNGWKDIKKNGLLSGFLDVSLINDQVYTSMKLPSENSNYFFRSRTNASIMDSHISGCSIACGIGAFYPVYGEKLPDEFNLCIGNFMVFVLKNGEDSQWELFGDDTVLQKLTNVQLRPLPWTRKVELSTTRPVEKVEFYKDYIEFNLTASDLAQTKMNPEGSVVHFYSDKLPIISDEIRACVVIYEMWSDTPDIEGKVVATVGFDFWSDSSHQMFSGRNYLVTNEHRLVIGHNISDELYYDLLDEGKAPAKCLEYFTTCGE